MAGPVDAMALVRTTVGDEAQARALARRLVEQDLAACVHVSRVHSTYRWKGSLEATDEWLAEARCLPTGVVKLRAAMLAGHPYDVPLVEVIPISGVPPAYVAWAKGKDAL